MPFNPKFTITPKINKALVEIERVRGFPDAVKLNSLNRGSNSFTKKLVLVSTLDGLRLLRQETEKHMDLIIVELREKSNILINDKILKVEVRYGKNNSK